MISIAEYYLFYSTTFFQKQFILSQINLVAEDIQIL